MSNRALRKLNGGKDDLSALASSLQLEDEIEEHVPKKSQKQKKAINMFDLVILLVWSWIIWNFHFFKFLMCVSSTKMGRILQKNPLSQEKMSPVNLIVRSNPQSNPLEPSLKRSWKRKEGNSRLKTKMSILMMSFSLKVRLYLRPILKLGVQQLPPKVSWI